MANQIAYGFQNMQDLFNQRVTQIGIDVVATAIDQSLEEHNRQMDRIRALFARDTTDFKTRFKTPIGARLQPLDDNADPRPIKGVNIYDVAFPLYQAGAAWGSNYRTRQKMTVQEANQLTVTLLEADLRWMRDHILAALFQNTSYSFVDDIHGTITVLGLANGDSQTYAVEAGADLRVTENHYKAQSASIDDADNPFPAVWTDLQQHPENSGEIICLAPTNLLASIKGLTDFRPLADPNVIYAVTKDRLVGDLPAAVPGMLWGYVDRIWVTEWKSLPSNYMIFVMTEGERALAMRQEPETTLQGFNRVGEDEEYPYYETDYLRIAGFGAWNRVNAIVYQIGSGSYSVPTGYSVPMA